MTTADTDDDTLEELAEYLRLNPEATTPEALGATDTDPAVWGDIVDGALATDEPHLALETPDTGASEGNSRDANPTLEADKPASTTSDTPDTDGSALVDALEWFHQQLNRDLPDECDYDTPRDYYRDGRGWSADTIDEKLLGYAPANYKDDLIAYLFDRGHGRDEILATGLFGERDDGNLYATWSGRYVLPYFDADGRPVFAISRATDPVHSADWKGNKYDKLQVTREDVTAEEPIYGLDTLEPGEPVLITEGIADAITAHQAGYPCLSPVTVQFKNSDREDLLDALAERDVGRAYLIQDAERPTSDVDDRDRLTLQQFGDGVKGAVRTAAYLDDHGLEARVAELPRPGLEKVDLDDYLQGWSDDLTPLLAGAKPVDQHPAYDPDTARDVALDAAEASTITADAVDTDGDHSALFDLTIPDVTGLSWDYRGANPLGHHGESENYFVLLEGHGVAYDHKYKAAYNALTYLLVDAGERRPTSPNGRLDDAEVFAAWRHAKREGCIPDDDPIPHRALQYVAREHDLMEDGDLMDGWKLPREAYNAALEKVREEYGVDPGRGDIAAGEREHTAVLPAAVRDLTTAASGWDWKHAGRDDDTLTVEDARERTVDAIADAYTSSDRVLVEALPTMGKSYGAVKAAADTDQQVTVLTGRGHKEQYEQFREWCDEHGLDYYTLPSFTRDCDTANGEHGQEWADTVAGWYRRGATPKEIHKSAEYVLDRPLPCQEHEGQRCPYASKWDFDPDEYDVLIGHYNHAHKTKVSAGRTVVFDEFPDAYETLLGPELQGAVSYWLQATDDVPFDDYTDLLENRDDQSRRADALLWFDEHGVEPDETHVFDDASAHAAAPLAVFTLLASDDLGNGFERADLEDVGLGVFDRARGGVSVLQAPALEYASGVVALDGTPTKRMWELALGERLNHRPVLQGAERAEYVRDALNLNLVRTTEYVKPYNSADHVNTEQDAALLEAITERHGERPAVITTTTAEHEYDADGVLEHVADTKHYGNVLGSNEFDDTRLGAVIGSNHYGDHYIKKWGAYAGEAVDRGEEKGAGLSYSGFGDDVLQHMREHDTLQAAMRFGRDGNGAVVYVHTDTLPEWVPLAGEGRVLTTWSDGMRDVVDALRDLTTATTADVVAHPAVDLSRQQVFDHLENLRERGVLQRQQDTEDGRRVVWRDDGLHRLGEHGDVELEPVDLEDLDDDEVRKLARSSIYTWEFTNPPAEDGDSTGDPSLATVDPPRAPANGGDRPPDDAD
ncbi:hypothetical protein [Halomarina litorea]|uniref:hypothetical protein n=1 Tax=Halomarina litorea TaxID=2961595 RepID=UPI0020C1F9DC|nr:hypothetical protein [Halomarina sp. BCD28]